MRCGSKLAPRCHRPLHPVLSRPLPTHRLPNLTSGMPPCSRLPGFDSRSQEDTAAPFVSLMCMMRNRDLVCAMLRHRMERIENMRWDVGENMPEDEKANISENEQTFWEEYNNLLSAWLASPNQAPPAQRVAPCRRQVLISTIMMWTSPGTFSRQRTSLFGCGLEPRRPNSGMDELRPSSGSHGAFGSR